jgi:hypothetical protein
MSSCLRVPGDNPRKATVHFSSIPSRPYVTSHEDVGSFWQRSHASLPSFVTEFSQETVTLTMLSGGLVLKLKKIKINQSLLTIGSENKFCNY